MNANQYYKPSGRFSPIGLVTAVGVGVGASALCALLYGYAIAWVPFVYINILLVFGYAIGCGALVALGLTLGKVRNTTIGALVGAVVGVFAMYAAWVVWLLAQSSQEIFIMDPLVLFGAIQLLGEQGVWSMKDLTPTGWFLYSFWLVEAGGVVGTCIYMGYNAVADNPFCEKCDCWMDDAETLGAFENPSDLRKVQTGLEAGRLDTLGMLQPIPDFSVDHTAAIVEVCGECKTYQLLSFKNRTITHNKDGEAEVKEETTIGRLVVDAKLAEAVSSRWTEGLAELAQANTMPVADSEDSSEIE